LLAHSGILRVSFVRTESQSTPAIQVVGGARRRKLPQELGLARITIDLPEVQHKRLKIAAIEAGTTVRQLVMDLLEREGITSK
jgi:hypothetical protein